MLRSVLDRTLRRLLLLAAAAIAVPTIFRGTLQWSAMSALSILYERFQAIAVPPAVAAVAE